MKRIFLFTLLIHFNKTFCQSLQTPKLQEKFVLVVHGGAGTLLKSQMTPEKEKAYTDALDEALMAGYEILKAGGTALDAVEACVKILEDNPLFNAGKGAVFTNDGRNELDASIMDGKSRKAGSVAGVSRIKNPVTAARAVMEKSRHVMLIGGGAESFARLQGLEMVDPSYFYTESRWKSLQKIKAQDSAALQLDHSDTSGKSSVQVSNIENEKHGTVGAVALDRHGNLAAATSTGGMTNKRFGRVGDSPVIGAGTYADNNTAAISCTGWGEYFIRLVLAKTVCDMMEYGKMSLKKAADIMIKQKLPALGGDGGLIAVDKHGNIAMPFCTEGMYRGYILHTGKKVIKIYKD
ncbi:MAG: isoaspartyl peptidase/L-asparaginase [Chitinophagaceae bacterium]|nr:isoaspartyl peptidase/L-asparaginase [Chitinophagaceae bacterium]